MICKHCGKELSDDLKFCLYCGQPLDAPEAEETASPETEAEETTFGTPTEENTQEATEETDFSEPEEAETPIPDPAAEQAGEETKKKPLRKQTAGKRVLSILLSVLLAFMILPAGVLTVLRVSLSDHSFENWLEGLDLKDLNVPGANAEKPLAKELAEFCKEHGISDNATEDAIAKILESDLATDFVSELFAEYRDFVLHGTVSEGLTASRVVNFLRENEEEINALANDAGMEGALHFDYDVIRSELNETLTEDLSIEAMSKYGVSVLPAIRFGMTAGMLTLWGLCLMLVLVLALINRRILSSLLLYSGIPALINGLMLCCGASSLSLVTQVVDIPWLTEPLRLLLHAMLTVGVVLAILGVLCIIGKIVAAVLRRKRI